MRCEKETNEAISIDKFFAAFASLIEIVKFFRHKLKVRNTRNISKF
ncbi:unnamed protein product [Onchocerca flexuosa]|uniref:Uncharacterized protein n=1 Tax=Onchocerca flexuosa TaxID=387005 RepID=A0A183HIA7_9BILA|nr:unnamed protein product [Onchocerca flexuosa]